jgi:hypothetical protein
MLEHIDTRNIEGYEPYGFDSIVLYMYDDSVDIHTFENGLQRAELVKILYEGLKV